MQLSGQQEVAIQRAELWERLHDPEVLARCLPGCESLETLDDGSYRATVMRKLGPIKARFRSLLQIEDIETLHTYKLSGKGDGGPTGAASGVATITLRDADAGGTVLEYEASVTITGRLAQIGGRLIEGAADSFASEFFERLAADSAPDADAERPTSAEQTTSGWWSWQRVLVVVALAILLVALSVYFIG